MDPYKFLQFCLCRCVVVDHVIVAAKLPFAIAFVVRVADSVRIAVAVVLVGRGAAVTVIVAAIFWRALKEALERSRKKVSDSGIVIVNGDDRGSAEQLRNILGELEHVGACALVRVRYGVVLRNDVSDHREILPAHHGSSGDRPVVACSAGNHLTVAADPENRDFPLLLLSCRDKGFVVEALSRLRGFDVADDGLFDRHGIRPAGCAVGDFEGRLAYGGVGFGCLRACRL